MGQFDDLVPESSGTESSGTPNQFDDLVPKRDRSFLGASLKSGLQSVPAAIGRVVEAVNPFTTSPEELAILEKDPKKREELVAKTQAATALGRGRQAMEEASAQTMREVRPEDREIQEKEYATLDPEKAAYLSPTRVAGDVLRNLPNVAVMAAGGVAARGAAASASAEALAAGATAEAARAAGAAAAARAMGGISAVGEGALGYAQQAAQVQAEVLNRPDTEFLTNPEYLALLEKGYAPDAAKQIIAARAAQAAGLAGGLADMALGKAGGEILGRVVGEGGRLLSRTGKAFTAEAGQEALQSAGESVGANIAQQQAGFSGVGTFDDLLEEVVSGAVVGGVTGGGFGAVAGKPIDTAKALKERQDVLQATAISEDVKAQTGLTPSQNAALNANKRQLAPSLTPIQQNIQAQAVSKGFDPDTALIISSIETGGTFNPTLKNKSSTAHGLFQMLDGTWTQYGGGDRNDVNLQISNGINNLVATGTLLEADLNRVPTATELYMGQLFGARGASTILQSPDNMSILDAVKKYDAANAEAIVNNNGMKGMTVAEVKAKWAEKVEQHRLKLGLNPEATGITQAGTDIDGVLGEIDAMLAESDSTALTAEEQRNEQMERSLAETREGSDVLNEGVINAALEAQDAGEAGATRVASVQPTLPQDLRGAAPTYYSGAQGYNIQFDSDLDKAAYIIANNQSRSKRDADYVKFVMDATGMTEEEARAYGKEVRVNIRNQLKAAGRTQDGSLLTVRISPTDGGKFNEGFVSNDEFGSRQKYPNPNDGTPFTQTPILAATDEAAIGQTLKDAKPGPGQVFAISHESNVAPPEYVRAVQQTLQTWVNRFSPTMRLIASFRTDRQPGQTGSQVETAWFVPRKSLGRGLYQINARPLYNFGLTEDGSRNSTTQAKAAYSLAHEFGHALVEHEFLRGLTPDQQNIVNTIGTWEYFGDDFLSQLPPEKAAVLREYNELKRAAETDSMTGVEWATRWLSPWKLAHGTGTKKGIESFLNKFLGEGASKMSARQLAETMQARGDMLSVHEYMAEQMSRYAQSSNAFKGTPLEGNQFFARTFEMLKEFFRSLKATKVVAPGTAFKDWVDSLTRMNQETVGEASQTTPVRKAAGKPRIRRRAVAVLPPSILPPPAETQATVEALGPSEGQKLARQMLHGELGYLKAEDPHLWADMAELVRTGQLEAFKSEVALQVDPEMLDRMRWDTSEPADIPWKNTLDEVAKVLPKRTAYSWVSEGFRKMADMKYYAMTMRQAAYANPEVAGLQLINNTLTQYKSLKAWLEVDATKVSQAWAKLGKEQRGLMERAMRAEYDSGENWFSLQNVNGKIRFVPSDRVREYASKNKLDEATVGVWMNSKNTYLQHMNTLHNVLRKRLEKRLAESPATLRARMKELAETFAEIRNRPFIPQTRFGQYAIRVEEDNGQVLHLEYFESPQQRDAAVTALKGKVGAGRKVIAHNYSISSSILRTIPPQLLSTYASEMELTREQKRELREMLDLQTSNPQIRRYSSQLAQITGAGKDLLRSYADFMWHDSTNVAKMHAREEFNRGLRMINEDRTLYEDDFAKHDELSKMYNFADGYVKHILNPADEYSMVRSFVVVKQLWGNIKTAIANVNSLAQLWAVATTRQGLVQGTKTVGKTAGGQVIELVDRLSNMVTRGPSEGYRRLPAEERRAMAQAQQFGILDETFAAQLASFANVGTLERLNATGNKWTKRVLWAGMQPQHLVENYTRRVTFLASFRGYRNEGMDYDRAFEAAQRDTILLQGDNSLQNRPPFMRGKAALFTIYYGYMQNMLYLMSGGYERARRRRADIGIEKASGKFNSETAKMWMAYAFLGGLMGLPGAEDLDNILSLVADKMFGKRFNLKEYAYELANSISEGASEFGLDISPRSIVHGNLADATAFGLLPGVDLSASMSLGNAIPGASGLGELGQKGGGYKFLIAAMGPMGREVDSMIRLFDDDPSLLKKFNLIAPAGIKNLATAWNESEAGALYPSGGKVTRDLVTGEIRDMTTGEVLARSMGFSPSVQTANRELHYMQKDAEMYWVNKRNTMLTQYWEAVRQGDREAIADVREKVAEFNEDAPPPMRLDGGDLSKSVKARARRARADELGIPVQKQSRQTYSEMADTFRGTSRE